MNESSGQTNLESEKTWLSSFMLSLGLLSLIAAVVALLSGGFFPGLLGLAIAAVFLALGRTLDYLQKIAIRLDRLESRDFRK